MPQQQKPATRRFGAFSGVFTPTILTILGLILFLRTGWLVGQTGMLGALAIVGLACLISLCTGLSLSAIASNMRVGVGGSYFMISRTLGLQIGGAIGIPLYLSQAVSVAFYVIGFTEALVNVFPQFPPNLTATAVVLLFGLLAYVGAGVAIKVQYVIMGVLGLALLSFFAGGLTGWTTPEMLPPEGAAATPLAAFAVFFPAVTGITVGVSMSGDLRDPGRDIPKGTLSAIGVSTLIYLLAVVWLAMHNDPEQLRSDTFIMHTNARWPWLILAGVWASTLSSALGTITAAPRVLQSLARDRVAPRGLASNLGSRTEPRAAVLLTTVLALGVIWLGDLDFVAPIITMFFLNTYGMVNTTAGLEKLVGNPSYRPAFNTPWPVSLLGALGCYATMVLINPLATLFAVVASYSIFFLLSRRSLRQNWGDLRSGIWYTLARHALLMLEFSPRHAKNWRPNLLAMVSLTEGRDCLMEAGSWLCSGNGMVTFYHLTPPPEPPHSPHAFRDTVKKSLDKKVAEMDVAAFAECAITEDFDEGVMAVSQALGVTVLETNTVLMGLGESEETVARQVRLTQRLLELRKSVLFFRPPADCSFGERERIDVWWRGRDRNGELMLLLAHLVHINPSWEHAEMRVLRYIEHEEGREQASESTRELLAEARVRAEVMVLVKSGEEQTFAEVFEGSSQDADLVVLSMPPPDTEHAEGQARRILERLKLTDRAVLLARSGEVEDVLGAE